MNATINQNDILNRLQDKLVSVEDEMRTTFPNTVTHHWLEGYKQALEYAISMVKFVNLPPVP